MNRMNAFGSEIEESKRGDVNMKILSIVSDLSFKTGVFVTEQKLPVMDIRKLNDLIVSWSIDLYENTNWAETSEDILHGFFYSKTKVLTKFLLNVKNDEGMDEEEEEVLSILKVLEFTTADENIPPLHTLISNEQEVTELLHDMAGKQLYVKNYVIGWTGKRIERPINKSWGVYSLHKDEPQLAHLGKFVLAVSSVDGIGFNKNSSYSIKVIPDKYYYFVNAGHLVVVSKKTREDTLHRSRGEYFTWRRCYTFKLTTSDSFETEYEKTGSSFSGADSIRFY
jgi:hypothetical protein